MSLASGALPLDPAGGLLFCSLLSPVLPHPNQIFGYAPDEHPQFLKRGCALGMTLCKAACLQE